MYCTTLYSYSDVLTLELSSQAGQSPQSPGDRHTHTGWLEYGSPGRVYRTLFHPQSDLVWDYGYMDTCPLFQPSLWVMVSKWHQVVEVYTYTITVAHVSVVLGLVAILCPWRPALQRMPNTAGPETNISGGCIHLLALKLKDMKHMRRTHSLERSCEAFVTSSLSQCSCCTA